MIEEEGQLRLNSQLDNIEAIEGKEEYLQKLETERETLQSGQGAGEKGTKEPTEPKEPKDERLV